MEKYAREGENGDQMCIRDSYYKALYTGDGEALAHAAACSSLYCFPNRLEDIVALRYAMEHAPQDAKAPYYLGCLWYDKRQYDQAIACWERSAELDETFPTVWRNLALAYFNKRGEKELARRCMEKAFALDETDARVLLELDQLCRKLGSSVAQRLAFLDAHRETAFRRDDLYVEYCTLLNLEGRYAEALELIQAHHFHPWEGGEGKVTTQYALSLIHISMTVADLVLRRTPMTGLS